MTRTEKCLNDTTILDRICDAVCSVMGVTKEQFSSKTWNEKVQTAKSLYFGLAMEHHQIRPYIAGRRVGISTPTSYRYYNDHLSGMGGSGIFSAVYQQLYEQAEERLEKSIPLSEYHTGWINCMETVLNSFELLKDAVPVIGKAVLSSGMERNINVFYRRCNKPVPERVRNVLSYIKHQKQ